MGLDSPTSPEERAYKSDIRHTVCQYELRVAWKAGPNGQAEK